MEQKISQAYAPLPLTLPNCLVDGQIDKKIRVLKTEYM